MNRVLVALALALVASPLRSVVPAQEVRGAPTGEAWEPWPESGRQLDWPRFAVEAHLDSSGRLLVREVQTIRFRGDWNGGERIFTTRFGQRFRFHRLARLDTASGTERELVRGDLDVVDAYDWTGSETLRWRSRRPTDPPFDDTRLTYVLEYEYGRILVPTDSGWLLDHEFAFREREGRIDDFELTLTLDPAWRAPAEFAGRWREASMAPGLSFLVTVPLRYVGAGVPSSALRGAPSRERLAIAALAIGVLAVLVLRFLRAERADGRFAPVPVDEVNPTWIRDHLLPLRAEVVGAAWDMHVGPAEVAALLARLVTERKLASSVRTKGKGLLKTEVLHLERTADLGRFTDYERSLLDGLFASGARTTSTETLRERYASTGYDPAGSIRRGVLSALDQVPQSGGTRERPAAWRSVGIVLVAGLAVGIVAAPRSDFDLVMCLAAFGLMLLGMIVAGSQASLWRDRVHQAAPHALRYLVPLAALSWALVRLALDETARIGLPTMACAGLFLLAAGVLTLHRARSHQSPERLAFRKRLAAARHWFRVQLASPAPQLEDAWYPYLLAFGLNRHVTRWFKRFGAPDTTREPGVGGAVGRGSSRLADSGSSGSGWSGFGGGGGFAGAGATVAFGSAVASLAGGVSAPSSSGSSGGGSSSSGGSSGGGGGGGW
jgi:hypothetical protein